LSNIFLQKKIQKKNQKLWKISKNGEKSQKKNQKKIVKNCQKLSKIRINDKKKFRKVHQKVQK